MAADTDLLLTMNRWDYETAKQYRLGHKVVDIPGVGVDFSRFDQREIDHPLHIRDGHGRAPAGHVDCPALLPEFPQDEAGSLYEHDNTGGRG